MTVERDHVPAVADLARELWATLDLLPDQEERGANPGTGQDRQDRWCPLGMRAVVEGDGHAHGPAQGQRDPEPAGDGRRHRGERG